MRHTTYQQVMPGVYKVIPCSCNQCMQDGQAAEQKFESFLERLNKQYEEIYGRSSPSFTEHQRTKNNRKNRELLSKV